jgi:hypothetical protein
MRLASKPFIQFADVGPDVKSLWGADANADSGGASNVKAEL